MKDLEKQIEEAALIYGDSQGSAIRVSRREGFKSGSKSNVAKEYWQRGMYTEEECYIILKSLIMDIQLYGTVIMDDTDLKKWFKENKKKQ